MSYLLIQIWILKSAQLAFWFIYLYLGSKSTSPEFWIYFPSHLSSWQLKSGLPVFFHPWKTKHHFSAAGSGTNQGAEGNNLLFRVLYFESFEGLEHISTVLSWTAAAGDSVLPSAGKPPKQTFRNHPDNLSNMTWDRKERVRNKCPVVTKKCSLRTKHTLHRILVRITSPQWCLVTHKEVRLTGGIVLLF